MKVTTRFNPRILELRQGYSKARFSKDLGAGLTVSVVALPLAMAFAIASGLKPEAGIFTAIIAGFLISLFSGSKVQIGGPAGAFIVIVYGIVQQYGVEGLLLATLMSGAMLALMGFLRMGILIKFIPVAVIIGFTNGIAVVIGVSQIKDFLGLKIEGEVPAAFFELIKTLFHALPTVNLTAVGLSLFCLALIILWQYPWQQKSKKAKPNKLLQMMTLLPGSIIALVIGTLVAAVLHLNVETIGSKFGGIPQALPSFTVPAYDLATIKALFLPALTLAILGAIESLLCARVADSMIKDRHDANQELLAQGIANMTVPFFGGMPATGTIARTVTNLKNGGSSPISGMVHALGLLIVVLIAAPLAQYIPLAALSAILLFVAWNMGEWRKFAELKHFRMPYRILLLAVFILTVTVDLTVAVQSGIIFASFIFIYRISSLSGSQALKMPENIDPYGIQAYQLSGALFFGAVQCVENLQNKLAEKTLILDFSAVIYIDSSGEEALDALLDEYRSAGRELLVCSVEGQPFDILTRTGWLKRLGAVNIFKNSEALFANLAAR